MNNNYFILNNEKYIVEYSKNIVTFYKYVDGKNKELSENEKQEIVKILNSNYSYVYDSEYLKGLVDSNPEIEQKQFIINFLEWLENLIPEDSRDNLYRNIKTLKTKLSLNIDLSIKEESNKEYSVTGGYNTSLNSLVIHEKSLREIYTIALSTNNPNEFYFKHYALILLHEFAHMASSNYDPISGISLCGFDTFPFETV